MNKLLVLMLVLEMASMALAIPVFRIAPEDVRDGFYPSSVITIQLYDSGQVEAFSIDAITDNGVGGIALEPQVIHPNLRRYGHFGTLNSNGMLVEYVDGINTDVPQQPATGVLYSFEYHYPDVPYSTILAIETFADGDNYFLPEINYIDGSYYEGHIGGLYLHIIPEPATLALLGLGAVILRKPKK